MYLGEIGGSAEGVSHKVFRLGQHRISNLTKLIHYVVAFRAVAKYIVLMYVKALF